MICPIATQDIKVNLKNRDWAFKNVGYGPANPNDENEEFWAARADEWQVSPDDAKEMRCGNCAAFIQTPEMMQCIEKGIGDEPGNYSADIVATAGLGYCELFEFKCAADRVCSAWLVGGPIKQRMTERQRQTLMMAKQEYRDDGSMDEEGREES